MPTSKSQAEGNLDQFIQKYGREGFLKLFLTNYLQELIFLYIHSRPRKEEDDTSSLIYVNFRGQSYSASQVDNFKRQLRRECAVRADRIVSIVKESGLLARFGEDPSKVPEIARELDAAFEAMVRDIE